jgi:hypothetical protein
MALKNSAIEDWRSSEMSKCEEEQCFGCNNFTAYMDFLDFLY